MLNSNRLFIAVVLTTAVVVGGTLAAYQHQVRQQAERIEREWAAEQTKASAQADKAATVAEGRTVLAHIDNLKAMRSELSKTMDALNKKAKSSASASRSWDRTWAERKSRYRQRYAAVRAHNDSERRRYAASETERANADGELVVVRTYTPRYLAYPSRPKKPGPLEVSVASEIARLSKLRERIDALESTIASESPDAQSFGSVYEALSAATQALRATAGDATSAARAAVVKRGAKGRVLDASRLSKVNQSALDDPFAALEESYSDALAKAGLSAEQVTNEAADVQ